MFPFPLFSFPRYTGSRIFNIVGSQNILSWKAPTRISKVQPLEYWNAEYLQPGWVFLRRANRVPAAHWTQHSGCGSFGIWQNP